MDSALSLTVVNNHVYVSTGTSIRKVCILVVPTAWVLFIEIKITVV